VNALVQLAQIRLDGFQDAVPCRFLDDAFGEDVLVPLLCNEALRDFSGY
jgi:hypothetical protein